MISPMHPLTVAALFICLLLYLEHCLLSFSQLFFRLFSFSFLLMTQSVGNCKACCSPESSLSVRLSPVQQPAHVILVGTSAKPQRPYNILLWKKAFKRDLARSLFCWHMFIPQLLKKIHLNLIYMQIKLTAFCVLKNKFTSKDCSARTFLVKIPLYAQLNIIVFVIQVYLSICSFRRCLLTIYHVYFGNLEWEWEGQEM